jgi:hypothetical protein
LHLVGLHVDQETVRRILRQRQLPAIQQVGAHEAEQQQGHQPEAECGHLRDAGAGAAADVGEAVAKAAAQVRTQPSHDQDQQPGQQREHGECRGDAQQHRAAERGRSGLPP